MTIEPRESLARCFLEKWVALLRDRTKSEKGDMQFSRTHIEIQVQRYNTQVWPRPVLEQIHSLGWL